MTSAGPCVALALQQQWRRRRTRPGLAKRRVRFQVSSTKMQKANLSWTPHYAGFVEEMRFVAMKLHTREQAPKEGKQEAPQPITKVQSTSALGFWLFMC